MGNPGRNRYKRGDWLADCGVCGFTYYASELRKRWDGVMVCASDFEERHPQDLLRIPRSERPVPWTRPQEAIAASTFVNPITGATDTTSPSAKYVTFGPVDPDSL
jgi:hypothetical protein